MFLFNVLHAFDMLIYAKNSNNKQISLVSNNQFYEETFVTMPNLINLPRIYTSVARVAQSVER